MDLTLHRTIQNFGQEYCQSNNILCNILFLRTEPRTPIFVQPSPPFISMLDKYRNVGWKKFYLVYGMCDESFTINCTVKPPSDIDKGWFMFFVTLLSQIYWISGATLGTLLDHVIHFDTTGIEFVMTALIGLSCSFLCLLIFGNQSFLLPSMALIVLCFTFIRKRNEKNTEEVFQ